MQLAAEISDVSGVQLDTQVVAFFPGQYLFKGFCTHVVTGFTCISSEVQHDFSFPPTCFEI